MSIIQSRLANPVQASQVRTVPFNQSIVASPGALRNSHVRPVQSPPLVSTGFAPQPIPIQPINDGVRIVNEGRNTQRGGNQSHQNSFIDGEETAKPKSKLYSKRKYVNLCLSLCPMIIAVLFFITAFIILTKDYTSDKDLKSSDLVLENVYKNLSKDPITQINTSQTNCPDDFSQNNLGEWPGINRGCICDDGQAHDYSYCAQNWRGCKLQGSRDGYELQIWDQDTKVCVEKNSDWEKQVKCDSGYNQCYENICANANQQCGENEVNQQGNGKDLVVSSLKSLFDDQPWEHSSNFKIGDFYYRSEYNYESSRSNTPIVDVVASTGNSPCMNPRYAPSTSSGKYYPLLKQAPSGCDEYGDMASYSIPLSSMAAKDFYRLNGLSDTFDGIQDFNNFSDSTDKIYLMALKRIRVNPSEECQQVQYGDFSIVQEFSGFGRGLLLFFTWILLFAAIVTILFGVLYILRVTGRIPVAFEEQKQITAQAHFYSSIVLIIVALLIGIIYHYAFTSNIDDVVERMKNYIQFNCFQDKGIVRAMNQVISYNEESGSIYDTSVHFLVIFSILYLIFWGIVYYIWSKRQAPKLFNGNQPGFESTFLGFNKSSQHY